MEKAFEEYIATFSSVMDKISGKVGHTKRVKDNSVRIAKDLKLSDEDVRIAEAIGWLHDISRFEQMEKYNTYIDKISFNHAEQGCKLLFKDNLIEKFPVDKKDYDLIEFAIRNHNKLAIESTTNNEKILYSKIIRDADKLDIYLELKNETLLIEEQGDTLSPFVKQSFLEGNGINDKYVETRSDKITRHLAFIYDFNFAESFRILKELDLIEVFRKLYPKNKEFGEILSIADKYINERIDEHVR